MRRSRGFTILEVMVATAMVACAAAAIGGVIHGFQSEDKLAQAYAEDLDGLRIALRAIERDLMSATKVEGTTIDGIVYELGPKGCLLRDGKVVAESVGSFSIRQRLDFATVRLSPAPRAQGRSTSPRELVLQVHLRRLEDVR